jgi:hypothetical protein
LVELRGAVIDRWQYVSKGRSKPLVASPEQPTGLGRSLAIITAGAERGVRLA